MMTSPIYGLALYLYFYEASMHPSPRKKTIFLPQSPISELLGPCAHLHMARFILEASVYL